MNKPYLLLIYRYMKDIQICGKVIIHINMLQILEDLNKYKKISIAQEAQGADLIVNNWPEANDEN